VIFHYPQTFFSLADFGIAIPLHDKYIPLLQYLKKNHCDKIKTFESSPTLSKEDLLLAHTEEYVMKLLNSKSAIRVVEEAYELINSDGTYNRYQPSLTNTLLGLRDKIFVVAASVIDAAVRAKSLGIKQAFFIGGGMHHAMSFRAGGFCLVNDIVMAIRTLQQRGLIRKALVIDVDAHKGDGTAEITASDETIFTVSVHMANGWPLDDISRAESFLPSSIDLPVSSSEDYLKKLKSTLASITGEYEFAIVVQGADPYQGDTLPGSKWLMLTADEMLLRDLLVADFLRDKEIPSLTLMAGGYGPDVWKIYANYLDEIYT